MTLYLIKKFLQKYSVIGISEYQINLEAEPIIEVNKYCYYKLWNDPMLNSCNYYLIFPETTSDQILKYINDLNNKHEYCYKRLFNDIIEIKDYILLKYKL